MINMESHGGLRVGPFWGVVGLGFKGELSWNLGFKETGVWLGLNEDKVALVHIEDRDTGLPNCKYNS